MRIPGLLVTSGKGGVGKTLLSTNIAIVLSHYVNVALVDADIRSPNLTYVMGINNGKLEITQTRKIKPYRFSPRLEIFSTDQFYHQNGNIKRAIMPTGEEVRAIVGQSVTAVEWSDPNIFVFDSDPSTGDVFISIRDIFGDMLNAVVVTTNHVSSLNDCERTIDALMINNINIIGVVGNMVVNGHDDGIHALIAKVNERYRADMKYYGYIPMQMELADKNDAGDPGLQDSPIIRRIASDVLHRDVV